MSRAFFEQVVEALAGFVDPEHGTFAYRVSSRNAKAWFGTETREHYEVQTVRRDGVTVLEVGFHMEYSDKALSDGVLASVLRAERTWRKTLGAEPETGPFLGRSGPWRRVSETWGDIDLSDPGAAVEAADRLAEYINVIEPLRRA
jgi:hypothetical protein